MVINVQKLCPTLVAGLDVLAVGWSGRPLGLYDTVFPFGLPVDSLPSVVCLSWWWWRSGWSVVLCSPAALRVTRAAGCLCVPLRC